jgi:hypothetical protein
MDGRSALFQASAAGPVVLEATSKEDPSRSATVTLTVAPPATREIRAEILEPGCRMFRYWVCSGVPAENSITVFASITSTYEVNAVARIPGTGRETTLTASNSGGAFQGTLDLRGLSRGQHPLELAVTDTRGNALVVPGTLLVDRRPTLEVSEPVIHELATTSTLRVRASCQDDAGECTLTASVESISVTGSGTLDATLDLTPFAGRTVQLGVSAKDSMGQFTSRSFSVVVAGPALEPVASVPGKLVQADASRLLYVTRESSSASSEGLGILQRATGQTIPLPTPAGNSIVKAYLTASGAVFIAQPVPGNLLDQVLYETRPEGLLPLDPGVSSYWLKVQGDYAAWNTYPSHDLRLRRLSTGTTVRVAETPANAHDITEQGFVAFWDRGYDILTYRDGVTTRLTNDPDTVARNTDPVTDGTLVVYAKQTLCCTNEPLAIALHTGGQELLLSQPRPVTSLTPGRDYAVNAGWVAYTDRASGGQLQVWLRSPSGETRKVTDWSTSSSIEALGPEGQIALRNFAQSEERVHVSRGSGPLQDLGPIKGQVVWLDGAWHVLWADTLFRVR